MLIREIIDFANELNGSEPRGNLISKQANKRAVIVIHTEPADCGVRFTKFEKLDSDDSVDAFLKQLDDLNATKPPVLPRKAQAFKVWILEQNGLQSGNKRLGTTHGLMNSVPYVVVLSEKNVNSFEKKAEKMAPPTEGWRTTDGALKKLQDELTKSLKDVYLDFWKSFDQKRDAENALAFVLLPRTVRNIDRKLIYQAFENDRKREWTNAKFNTKLEMHCPVCEGIGILGMLDDFTYQDKKPFYRRRDRPDDFGLRACLTCASEYREAKEVLTKSGFRIFPIFIENKCIPDGLRLVNEDGTAKSFKDIFKEIKSRAPAQDRFNFRLVAFYKKDRSWRIWLYDYVSGYSPFFKKVRVPHNDSDGTINEEAEYSRFYAEYDFWHILGVEKNYPYFEDLSKRKDLKGTSNRQRSLIYALRERVFNFVYRGDESGIHKEDITLAVDCNILEALNSSAPCDVSRKILNSGFRLYHVLEWKGMSISEKDQLSARNLGRAFRIVLNLSEASNPHNLLGLALDKPNIDGVKSVLSRLLDKYHHKFEDLSKDEQKLISACLSSSYDVDKFDLLKMYFYAGYFEVQ